VGWGLRKRRPKAKNPDFPPGRCLALSDASSLVPHSQRTGFAKLADARSGEPGNGAEAIANNNLKLKSSAIATVSATHLQQNLAD
jgi:hypothetical protein